MQYYYDRQDTWSIDSRYGTDKDTGDEVRLSIDYTIWENIDDNDE